MKRINDERIKYNIKKIAKHHINNEKISIVSAAGINFGITTLFPHFEHFYFYTDIIVIINKDVNHNFNTIYIFKRKL